MSLKGNISRVIDKLKHLAEHEKKGINVYIYVHGLSNSNLNYGTGKKLNILLDIFNAFVLVIPYYLLLHQAIWQT